MPPTITTLNIKGFHIEGDQEFYNKFWQFIYDRHEIWYKRIMLQQPMPWTNNPIFRDFKFTNVYRELDRGTLYLLDHIIGDTFKRGPEDVQVFNTIMYRVFNRIETWEAIRRTAIPYERGKMFDILRDIQRRGGALYTDAHMVCAYENFPGDNKLERIDWIFDQIDPKINQLMELIWHSKSLQPIHKFLTNLKGIGPFLAYEMAVDISYAPWNQLGEDEWVNPGPGCQRGLKRIFPNLPTKECAWMIKVLREAQTWEFQRLGLPFTDIAYKGRELTLRNVEHCLCEFFKYAKALEGTGRPRNRFKPVTMIGDALFNRLKG